MRDPDLYRFRRFRRRLVARALRPSHPLFVLEAGEGRAGMEASRL